MTTAAAPPLTLTLHVVARRDVYDTRRCARCRAPVTELDVIAHDDRVVTHYDCLTQRALATLPPPSADAERCWYSTCPLPTAAYLLCAAHGAILYGDAKKPTRSSKR